MGPDEELARELEAEGVPDLEDAVTADLTDITPPPSDRPLGADQYGTTEAEQRLDEPIEDRVEREEADVLPAEAGAEEARAQGLVDPDGDEGLEGREEELAARETGDVSASPEEDAVRVLDEDEASR